MNRLRSTLQNSLTAMALRVLQEPPLIQSSSGHAATIAYVQGWRLSRMSSFQSSRRWLSDSSSGGDSVFQPATPPGTHGTPVFSNIDFSVAHRSVDAMQRNSDPHAVFVVTGANRGIGLQCVKALIERSNGTIVACCRSPETATDLIELARSVGDASTRVRVHQLDVENEQSIQDFGDRMRQTYTRVDLLLNVAGILGDGKTTPGPERSITRMDRDWFEKTIAVNLIGPVMLSKELYPLLIQSRKSKGSVEVPAHRAKAVVANLSARVGSISDNGLGGWYSYRMSKSALNQFTRTLALELKRHSVWTVALHPGTTDTGLSQPFQANVKEGSLFPVEFTVTQLLNVIDSMQDDNSGGFYDWSGQALSF